MFWIILSIGLALFIFFRANTKRGKNFVRAYYFLLCLDNGKSTQEANVLARQIATAKSNPDYDRNLIQMASKFSKENFNGKQLPIINLAVAKGYLS